MKHLELGLHLTRMVLKLKNNESLEIKKIIFDEENEKVEVETKDGTHLKFGFEKIECLQVFNNKDRFIE